MSADSPIEWTDHTFNPWWGCTKVSPGCDNCYAERLAARFGTGWGAAAPRREFMEEHWLEPMRWNAKAAREGIRRRVFCASMADVFDVDAPDGARGMLWDLIEKTPHLDWQLLTKRIGNAWRMVPVSWLDSGGWPAHVWIGATVVDQEEGDRDIPKLLALPARVRFLSCEPLIGPIDLRLEARNDIARWDGLGRDLPLRRVDWVIAGGESGPHARPAHPDWFRSLRDQCVAAGVPFLFKQWGEFVSVSEVAGSGRHHHFPDGATVRRTGKKATGRLLDGVQHDGFPSPA